MHQFKINRKMAFDGDGDVWQWHQDCGACSMTI
jgi:hypothetical protein